MNKPDCRNKSVHEAVLEKVSEAVGGFARVICCSRKVRLAGIKCNVCIHYEISLYKAHEFWPRRSF